ncbi:hypothetical protein ACLOJK_001452 [Asimina triloba]
MDLGFRAPAKWSGNSELRKYRVTSREAEKDAASPPTTTNMVRSYSVKGRKRKKRDLEEEKEEEEQEGMSVEEEEEGDDEEKVKEDEKRANEALENLPGISILPSSDQKKPKGGVIFVLERATLEIGKVGKAPQILNSDDHTNFLKKHNRNPADYRPDIVHQALLAILDSPLNKVGMVKAVYVKTEKGVLFEVKPHLLQTHSISATSNRQKLLREIKNPVTRHLPVNSRKIVITVVLIIIIIIKSLTNVVELRLPKLNKHVHTNLDYVSSDNLSVSVPIYCLSYSSEKLVQMRDYVAAASDDIDLVFVVGAMAHGKINQDYVDDFISTFLRENPILLLGITGKSGSRALVDQLSEKTGCEIANSRWWQRTFSDGKLLHVLESPTTESAFALPLSLLV